MRPSLFLARDDAATMLVVVAICALAALLATSAIAARRALLALPADFLVRPPAPPLSRTRAALRAIAGACLIGAGLLLLVLPGPGVLFIALGLMLWKTPSSRRLLLALMARPTALRAVNSFRRRHGRGALTTAAR